MRGWLRVPKGPGPMRSSLDLSHLGKQEKAPGRTSSLAGRDVSSQGRVSKTPWGHFT